MLSGAGQFYVTVPSVERGRLEDMERIEDMIIEAGAEAVVLAEKAKRKRTSNKGVAVIEIVLILVVLLALIVIFKDQSVALVNKIWNAINKGAGSVMN